MSYKYNIVNKIFLTTTDALPSDTRIVDADGLAHPLEEVEEPTIPCGSEATKVTKDGQRMQIRACDLATYLAAGWTEEVP